jgi:hypothetical protein
MAKRRGCEEGGAARLPGGSRGGCAVGPLLRGRCVLRCAAGYAKDCTGYSGVFLGYGGNQVVLVATAAIHRHCWRPPVRHGA